MYKRLKEWCKDINTVQRELNDMGLFTVYHQFGAYIHYVDCPKTTHINTEHDKQETISKDN